MARRNRHHAKATDRVGVSMATTARSIIERAQVALLDLAGVRWPVAELIGYLNDGQRALVVVRPDETAATLEFAPVEGAAQRLPADVMVLIDVTHNLIHRRGAITKVDRQLLDAVQRGWQGMRPTVDIQHFIHDLREPRVFLLYPPAHPDARLALTCSMYPSDAVAPSGGNWPIPGLIAVSDQWANALLDYVLFRAHAKDSQDQAAGARAAAHLGLFNSATGAQLQSAATVAPT